MNTQQPYDVAIIGGGLAGLGAAIQLVRLGHSVILFEKEKYPFHKVCGEYISMESWDFLKGLGVPLDEMHPPIIDQLKLTAPNGKMFTTKLPLGGFGISRFTLDNLLANIARKEGVLLCEETRVDNVTKEGFFRLHISGKEKKEIIEAKIVCGSFGKRSNLDLKWKRNFVLQKPSPINNYIGVKYHIRTDWKENEIGLHNFKNGYCGISKVEGENYCFCYLTTADNLKNCNSSIDELEERILSKNDYLKQIIAASERDETFPITISQISFDKKTQAENDVLLLGDAAGMITHLCGNGMSMALRSSKLATGLIHEYLSGSGSLEQLKKTYTAQWQRTFASRLRTGRILQRFFGAEALSNLFVTTFKAFPFLASPLIKQTHGQPF
jgi:flavin-dependent dehydrogenase